MLDDRSRQAIIVGDAEHKQAMALTGNSVYIYIVVGTI
jgi:hypothetical protein